MASLRVYAILDRKLREFGGPFVDRNDETVRRNLQGLQDGDSMMRKYPDDFDLYMLGHYETETGVLEPQIPVLVVGLAAIFGGV